MTEGLEEIVDEFLVESRENLDRLEREFIELEADPTSRELLASIFRTIHTIKGTAGFLGLDRLESVSHVGESVLSRLRDGELTAEPSLVTALLAMVDAIREMLTAVETSGTDGSTTYEHLTSTLQGFIDGTATATASSSTRRPGTGPSSSAPDTTIRVDVKLLDQLMALAGELVLIRDRLLQHGAVDVDPTLVLTSQRLDLITTELHEKVMATRMQPIGNIWSKFLRVVRDLAMACDKQVRIQMEGEGTELDKTILEAIKDPLTHVVRNAVDHGIESPQERLAAGKPAEGVLCLRAVHEGAQVVVEVADDGRGLDLVRIRSTAVDRGLITAEQASRLGEHDTTDLIFLPGFSTATSVTNVSGRGVGMDVVRSNIERIGGSVRVRSTEGHGTTLTVRIPLMPAIVPAAAGQLRPGALSTSTGAGAGGTRVGSTPPTSDARPRADRVQGKRNVMRPRP